MDENEIGKASEYKFKYTTTYSPEQLKQMAEEDNALLAEIGEWNNYFSLSEILSWGKRPWVPWWLWKLVAYPTDWIGKENS